MLQLSTTPQRLHRCASLSDPRDQEALHASWLILEATLESHRWQTRLCWQVLGPTYRHLRWCLTRILVVRHRPHSRNWLQSPS